jgi:tetratricopeptide (TPR) repeat protein
MRSFLRFFTTGMMAAACMMAQAQSSIRGVSVEGEISSSAPLTGQMTVELSGDSGAPQMTEVSPDGTFRFDSAPPGTHQLRVIGAGGTLIYQQIVSITGPSQRLIVQLPDAAPAANRAAGDTVCLQQLAHKVPKGAQKAFEKGRKAEHRNKPLEAEKMLRQAVSEDPEFADAHNELGAVEASLGKLPEAAAEFQKTIDMAPGHNLALGNLAIVLAKMKKFHDAAEAARRALQVTPQDDGLRYILGFSLVMDHGDPVEALANLRRAESTYPKAHLLEAQLLAGSGKKSEAAEQLAAYLKGAAPGDPHRAQIEADLARLQGGAESKQ